MSDQRTSTFWVCIFLWLLVLSSCNISDDLRGIRKSVETECSK